MDFNEKYELPGYIRIVTITGLVFLSISFIISVILASAFNHPRPDGTQFNSGSTRDSLIILTIVMGCLGFFFCCFVFYGHYLRNRYDPKSILKGPVNIVSFPHLDKEIKVNDMRNEDFKPIPRYQIEQTGGKNKLRGAFL